MSVNVPPTSTPIIFIVASFVELRSQRPLAVRLDRFQDGLRGPRIDPEAAAYVLLVGVLGNVMAPAADAGDEQHRRRNAPADDHRVMPGAALHALAARAFPIGGGLDAGDEALVHQARLDLADRRGGYANAGGAVPFGD